MSVLLNVPVQVLVCPNCDTREAAPMQPPDDASTAYAGQFHQCPGSAGMLAPLVPEGLSCKTEAEEREDYIGAEKVQLDANGRPIMAMVTTRDDGDDRIVFPGTATASSEMLS